MQWIILNIGCEGTNLNADVGLHSQYFISRDITEDEHGHEVQTQLDPRGFFVQYFAVSLYGMLHRTIITLLKI